MPGTAGKRSLHGAINNLLAYELQLITEMQNIKLLVYFIAKTKQKTERTTRTKMATFPTMDTTLKTSNNTKVTNLISKLRSHQHA